MLACSTRRENFMRKEEVDFEKRGKLEDHQTCPVCGACICDGHKHGRGTS
jgi:hypothetical protein